jgi:hypothetical protein
MYCQECDAEFGRDFKFCPQCGAALEKNAPPQAEPDYANLQTVLTGPDLYELMVARSRLEAEGIPCFTTNDMQDFVGVGILGGFSLIRGPQELQVSPKDFKRANEILDAVNAPEKE